MVRPVSKPNLPGLESEEGPIKVAALMPIKCKDQVVATPKPSPLCTNITKYHFQLLTRGRYDAVVSVGKAPTLATRTCSVKLHYAKMRYSYQSKKLLKYHVGFRCVHQSCIALVLHRACKLKHNSDQFGLLKFKKSRPWPHQSILITPRTPFAQEPIRKPRLLQSASPRKHPPRQRSPCHCAMGSQMQVT